MIRLAAPSRFAAAELAGGWATRPGRSIVSCRLRNKGDQRAEALLWRIGFAHGRTDELIALYETVARHDDSVRVLKAQADRTDGAWRSRGAVSALARPPVSPLGDEVAAAEAYREVLQLRRTRRR